MSLKPKKRHPFANIFPSMTPKEYEGLVSSIKEEGQLVPCLTVGNLLADGVHREKACIELGIEPDYKEWNGKGSLLNKVLGLNVDRRHLDGGQLALAAARAREHTAPEDKPSMEVLKNSFGVSKAMICHAEDVLANGAPEVIEMIDKGEVRLTDAVTIVDLPKAEQAEVAKKVASGEEKSLRNAAGRPKQHGRTTRRSTTKSNNAKKKAEKAAPVARDTIGNEITEAKVRDVFADRQIHDMVAALERCISTISKGVQWNPYMNNEGVDRQDMVESLEVALGGLKSALPHSVCKACEQKGCGLCREQGWVPEWIWREAEGLT